MDTPMTERRLHRSRTDRIVFGVCGGLGDYFAIDPVLVRLAFVLVTLAGGAGVLAYIILAIVLPEEGAEPVPGREGLRRNMDSLRTTAGDLAGRPATEPGTPFIESGTADAATPDAAYRRHRRQRSDEVGALILVALGLFFLATNVGWFHWFNWNLFWPLVLIVIGAAMLVRRTGRPA